MSTRRGFLKFLGLAGPAAVLAPTAMLESGKATNIPKPPLQTSGYLQVNGQAAAQNTMAYNGPPTRYLGYAQLKVEGQPIGFDPGDPYFEDEISRFAREAFRKEQFQWPDSDWEDKA